MADRFLKHKPSGHVFIYAPPFIDHEDFEECANAAGDPMQELEVVVNPPPRRKKADKLPDSVDDAGLSADASRGLAAQGL